MNLMKDSPGPREDGREAVTSIARYAAMLSTLSAVGTSPARAADPGCAPAPIDTDPLVRAAWPDLPDRLQGLLAGRRDVDTCARISIRLDQATFVVEVALPDGRSASRSVARKDEVVPTLEALLLLPLPAARPPEAEPVRAADPGVDRDRIPVVSAGPQRLATAARGEFRLEFSLAAGARLGDGQVGVGLGARTLFDLRGWLVGFEGATQRYGATGGGPGAAVLELAVLAGRRFRFGDTALDLTAGPALAMPGPGNTVAVSAQVGAPPSRVVTPAGDGQSKRLVCGARVTLRARSAVRIFAGIDGDVALERSTTATDVMPAEAPLPSWTFGLVVGTTVGTP
jgi:hypothetical protein